MVGIALDMLFKSFRKKKDGYDFQNADHFTTSYVENGSDGESVKVENTFGSTVEGAPTIELTLSSSFGEINIISE